MKVNLQEMAYEVAQSDLLQGFGIRTRINNKDQINSVKSWLELALRISHWTPIGLYTGFISLAIVAVKIYQKNNATNEDWSEVARAVSAIIRYKIVMAFLDVTATYLRMKGPGNGIETELGNSLFSQMGVLLGKNGISSA